MFNALPEDTERVIHYATKISLHSDIVKSIQSDQTLLIVFPLYTDSVPYVLKELLEQMEPLRHQFVGAKVYYIVQSGFGGGKHSRAVEKYLILASKLLGLTYMGTAIRPSSEGLRLMPESMLKAAKKHFEQLTEDIMNQQPFNTDTLDQLIPFETPSWWMKLAIRLGLGNIYFNSQLRKNNVRSRRYHKPYQKK
jgi:NAD(P)H-dependent FMN reductase